MAKVRLKDAPGCLGSIVLGMRDSHPLCNTCIWRKQVCRPMARKNAERLNEALREIAIEKRAKWRRGGLVEIPPEPVVVDGISKSANKTVNIIAKSGVTVDMIRRAMRMQPKDAMRASATWRPAWFRWALIGVMHSRGPISRAELVDAMMAQFQWGRATAQSHVSNFIATARHLELIAERNERIEFLHDD